MLSQAARGLLSAGSLFGSRANKENSQAPEEDSKSKPRSKPKKARLGWKSKERKSSAEAPPATEAATTTATTGDDGENETTKAPASEASKAPSNAPSTSSSERRLQRRRQSSPSCDLSSGYLSQTNGFLAAPKQQQQQQAGESKLFAPQNANAGAPSDRHRHRYLAEPDSSHRPARIGSSNHSHSFASSATMTRLPMVPMMIDDDDDEAGRRRQLQQLDLELNAEEEDKSDDSLAEAELDLERHHRSYQVMIDGLKRQQQQYRRQHRPHHQHQARDHTHDRHQHQHQHQHHQRRHQQRFVQSHRHCQQDDKLSLMLMHSAGFDCDDINERRHLSLIGAAECADSEPEMMSLQDQLADGHYRRLADRDQLDPNLASLARALTQTHQNWSTHDRLDDEDEDDDDDDDDGGTLNDRMLPSLLKYQKRGQLSTDRPSTFSAAEPEQRRPAIIYYQPDIAARAGGEHYAKLTSLHQRLAHQDNPADGFLHDPRHSKQASRASAKGQKAPVKAPVPPPPTRDQHIRGLVHQPAGQAQPNLASPIDSKLRRQVENARQLAMAANAQQSGRHHLASPEVASHHHHHLQQHLQQNHVKRSKSNTHLQQLAGSYDERPLQFAPNGARPVPKSASALLNGGFNGLSHSSGKMSANLQAISNGAQQMSEPPVMGCCGKLAKFLLFIANILFWCAGVALGAWGILALVEDHKYNLSQLLVFEPSSRMSLFQLLAWSFITLGGATILIGICGCSAMFKNSRWVLGLYIFLILAIFALDLATGLLAIIFQERLVANVRLRLVSKLRNEYGIQASFTAAIDYIQTRFECCGLDGHFDYEQSLWRLQRLGGFEATVARTCCHLRNTLDDQAHVNPRPVNESMCQSTDVRFHQSYRFRKGCLDDFEKLIRHKIWTFTVGCGIVGAIILVVLALATCFCRSIPNDDQNGSNAASRKSSLIRPHQQTAAKKQGNHQYHHHGHHGHHAVTSARHK